MHNRAGHRGHRIDICKGSYQRYDGDAIRLVVLAGKYDEPGIDLHEYRQVYNLIHHLEEICEFDGFIVSCAPFADIMKRAASDENGRHFLDIPKVYVGDGPRDATIVKCDNEIGIRSGIDFLININGCRKLCMLGGRDDLYDAIKRKEVFKQGLADNGIEFRNSIL